MRCRSRFLGRGVEEAPRNSNFCWFFGFLAEFWNFLDFCWNRIFRDFWRFLGGDVQLRVIVGRFSWISLTYYRFLTLKFLFFGASSRNGREVFESLGGIFEETRRHPKTPFFDHSDDSTSQDATQPRTNWLFTSFSMTENRLILSFICLSIRQ